LRDRFRPIFRTFEEVKEKLIFLHDKEGVIWPPVEPDGSMRFSTTPREEDIIVLKKSCTNDGANSGTHSINITPAAGSIVKLHYCAIQHDDNAATRVLLGRIKAKAATLFPEFMYEDIAHNTWLAYPRNLTGTGYFDQLGNAMFITDDLKYSLIATTLAVSKKSTWLLVYSYIGDEPDVGYSEPTNAVWADLS
jgi:hypothetical protein